MIRGKGSGKDELKAKQACNAEVVRKLFQADLLPRYDGNKENLVRWIAESHRKYKAQKDLLVWLHTHNG